MSAFLTVADDAVQPSSFAFSDDNQKIVDRHIAKYPPGKQASAVMPLLDLAQRQHGWIPRAAVEKIADMLGMPSIRVWEVVSFYTMYRASPSGRHQVQVCTTTPCWLRGSDEIVKACKDRLGVSVGETSDDGLFTLGEVECLGACVNAPIVQIDDDYYEDLDGDAMTRILDALARGETPDPGPQIDRQSSAPVGGPIVLKSDPARHEGGESGASGDADKDQSEVRKGRPPGPSSDEEEVP